MLVDFGNDNVHCIMHFSHRDCAPVVELRCRLHPKKASSKDVLRVS